MITRAEEAAVGQAMKDLVVEEGYKPRPIQNRLPRRDPEAELQKRRRSEYIMREAGATIKEIAEAFGVTRNTVRNDLIMVREAMASEELKMEGAA